MTTTLRIAQPADLLAYLPYRLGFQPQDCVILASLRSSTVGLVMRADLDHVLERSGHGRLIDDMGRHCARDGATAVIAVLYSDALTGPVLTWPERELLLLSALADFPVPVESVWVVGGGRYFEVGCQDVCCLDGGTDLADLDRSLVPAEMVYAGHCVAPDRASLAALETVAPDGRRRCGRAMTRWLAVRDLDVTSWRLLTLEVWFRLLDSATAPGDCDLGKMRGGMHDPIVRDALLASLVPHIRHRVTDLIDEDLEAWHEAVACIIDPDSTCRPDSEHLRRCDQILAALLARTPRRERAPGWALRALLAWWQGDGARAAVAAEEALRIEPSHPIAGVVHAFLDHGQGPGWTRAERE